MIKDLKDGATMLKNILEQLQPGNILLEKTPYTLTNKSAGITYRAEDSSQNN
jgi:hypothetical protein